MKKSTIALSIAAAAAVIGYTAYNTMFSVKAVEVNEQVQASKLSEYTMAESFITAQGLHELMTSEADVVVIGALNPMRPNTPIFGSFSMWRNDYSAQSDAYEFGGMRNTTEEMEQLLSQYGATADSTIVVYAADAHHDAARLFWQIRALGHSDIRYLDGGLNAWVGAGLPTGNANPTVDAAEYVSPNPEVGEVELATLDMVVEAQTNDDWVIIDTRSQAEFDGTTTVSGASGPGAIPQSLHIEWTDALNGDTTLKSLEELKELYGADIEGKKVITYCQSGVRSAHTLLVLKEVLGAEEVYNYDGSWIEYSHEVYVSENDDVLIMNGNS